MGSLIKIWKTLPMPAGAKIGRNGTVSWLAKGKKKTGKLSAIPGTVPAIAPPDYIDIEEDDNEV